MVSETIKELTQDGRYLGAEVGFMAILHIWSQTLVDHPHVHCIVTGGGLSRGKFLACLKEAYEKGQLVFPGRIGSLKEEEETFKAVLNDLYAQECVVYCKSPFRSAETVVDYLGRYTHRVAISNHRLVALENGRVTFRYRDRNDHDALKLMTLDAFEFIRRFLLHILPDGFMKIRHYGILSNRRRRTKLVFCRNLPGVSGYQENPRKEAWQDLLARATGVDPRACSYCGKGEMILKEVLNPSKVPLPP